MRILQIVFKYPGITEEEIYDKLTENSWAVRTFGKDFLIARLYSRLHRVNFSNDFADLEEMGLVRWEGKDPNWRYFPPNYPTK